MTFDWHLLLADWFVLPKRKGKTNLTRGKLKKKRLFTVHYDVDDVGNHDDPLSQLLSVNDIKSATIL